MVEALAAAPCQICPQHLLVNERKEVQPYTHNSPLLTALRLRNVEKHLGALASQVEKLAERLAELTNVMQQKLSMQ